MSGRASSDENAARAREIFRALAEVRRVVVTSEPLPDGDALGAELALDHIVRHAFLRGAAKGGARDDRRVVLVNDRGCPRRYRFLSGAEKIRRLDEVAGESFDLGIVVDGGIERAGDSRALFDRCATRVYIDHHKLGSRERYDLVLSDPRASSTTQLLWTFFADPEIAVPLSREVAEAVYLGLIYDTGSFQYSLTTPESHRIAARLMETGMDFARIHERALLEQEFENLLLLGKVLSTAERRGEAREIVHAAIPRDLARSMQVKSEDYNKVIQTLCFIDGVEVAVLFRELDGAEWKLSLRSRGLVDVAAIARELDPQGGGHDRAAGCTLPGPLEAAVERAVAHIDARVRAAKAARRGGGL